MGKSRDIADGTRYVDASGDTFLGDLTGGTPSSAGAAVRFSNNTNSNEKWSVYGWDDQFQVSKRDANWGWAGTYLAVDTSGSVLTPNQPAFVAYNAPAYLTDNTNIVWSSTVLNRGSVYNTSNGRFTAPVAGLYQFFASVRIEAAEPAATYHRVCFVHNGSDIMWSKSRLNSRTATGYYSHAASDQIVGCQAGDYVNVKFESSVGQFTSGSNVEHVFYGYLVG